MKKLSLSEQIKLVQDFRENGNKTNIVINYDKLIRYVIRKTLTKYNKYDSDIFDYLVCDTYCELFSKKLSAWDPYKYKSRQIKSLGGWIGLIATQITIDYLRKVDAYIQAPPKITISEDYKDNNYVENYVENYVASSFFIPEDQFDARYNLSKTLEYIKNMKPGKNKVIMELSVINGFSVNKIAKIINIPKKRISEIQTKGIKKLKEEIMQSNS
ncbi:MAG: RNA polymerase sigma factor, sigma-70 family [Candidatus Magnetoglobus multicellularis str. Araruama]|uniref:RNA polymerase sigma factor, sigma-70 family n=1 Tax=Candidatus Magnetoglobus multicellularis str. Araruama TaxID=890399 RepID=A0A1V1P332_9BACT|nr:MAG: RNA polymerase sigma factor, sigma-70 family [Candidatus Magnetoglobus multicellularis str. Araruama]